VTSIAPSPHQSSTPDRDQGTVLVLVLVLMIIGAMIVLPLLTYGSTVLRANTVLSSKTGKLESVKAGLRVSLADPASLYELCGANAGPGTPYTLPGVSLGGATVTTKCFYIDHQSSETADEKRLGVVGTQVGVAIPDALSGGRFVATDPSSPTEWIASTTSTSLTSKVWLPHLPANPPTLPRSSAGYQMKAGYPTCTVFFPGRYVDPVTLTGPAYFVSGLYMFEGEVRVLGGANVVGGLGATEGCTTDQDAIFYVVDPPSEHARMGYGVTFTFGKRGRLVIDGSNAQPIGFVLNNRYADTRDQATDSSSGVSIQTVNGELQTDGVTVLDLDLANSIHVPLSMVGPDCAVDAVNCTAPVAAAASTYAPSQLTPKPSVADAPTGLTVAKYNAAALLSWTAPSNTGNSAITGYTVTANPGGGTCTTSGTTTCAITRNANNTALGTTTTYTFTVTATNAVGTSSGANASSQLNGAAALTVPAKPNPPTAVPYDSTVRVTFSAPSPAPTAPVSYYTVTASPGGATCVVNATVVAPVLQCDISGLTNLSAYTFTVVAANAVGNSTASNASLPVIPLLGLGAAPVVTPPVVPATAITPVIDIDLTASTAATNVVIDVPGYVSIPQGKIRVTNPNGKSVRIIGGVLAAQFEVNDSRSTGPSSLPVGFVESIVQRKFRLETTTSAGGERSIATVQINQTGAYAINTWEVQ
jgi:hypothetical protein